ncbi:hypothetical protein [Deinococcus pimensis]|uniref:hypothetical protein n=1 Tax=Deinococcus pimensis TaxID=309888 RepID=UPI0012F77B38|nr:hypothetical protein [Deinococcus pimensis]
MHLRHPLILSLLTLGGSVHAIAPQIEPEQVLRCAAAPDCAALSDAARADMRSMTNARKVPFREALWTAQEREYKLVRPHRTLVVTVTRRGTGPWQVSRAATTAIPRVYLPHERLLGNTTVTVRASGFPVGARVEVAFGPANTGPRVTNATAVVAKDGTATLNFFLPSMLNSPGVTQTTATGATITVPAQDRLIVDAELVVVVGTLPDWRVKARTPLLAYQARPDERDLKGRHEGQLSFRFPRGHEVREQPGELDVLELNALEAARVMHARRVQREGSGPHDDAAYVRALLTLHPDVLRPFETGEVEVEGEVDTTDGRAWRLLARSGESSRPVYLFLRGDAVWVVQSDAPHAPLLDAIIRTVRVRP